MKTCKTIPGQVNPSDFVARTKFVAVYLFIKVKGSRPMTYQDLTVDMVNIVKENGDSLTRNSSRRLANMDLTR